MQNLSFRYTRYINWRKKRIGHLFQGRYKALLIDADNYLLELVRYIHCNPVRARMVQSPDEYRYSSHRVYLGKELVPWMTTEWILSQFAKRKKKAQMQYHEFILQGIGEDSRPEFYRGETEGRILGDDQFSEKALDKAEEKFQRQLRLDQLIDIICKAYSIDVKTLTEPGEKRPASEARAVAALLVQETENLTITALGRYLNRDLSSLSQAANRLGSRIAVNATLGGKLAKIRKKLPRIPKCQAP
jgi:putative transposase